MSALARVTPEQESLDRPIITAGIILSEGRTLEMFLRELIEKDLCLKEHVEARNFGGNSVPNLKLFLNNFATKPEFRHRVQRVGIIRDAESSVASKAFAAIVNEIRAFNCENPSFALPEPNQLAVMTPPGERPQVGVFILPDCQRPGMLETLCLDAIEEWEQNAPVRLLPCVSDFFVCLSKRDKTPANRPKAQFAAYALAADVIDPQLGRAAQMGAIPWKTRTFDPLKTFIRSIAGRLSTASTAN